MPGMVKVRILADGELLLELCHMLSGQVLTRYKSASNCGIELGTQAH